MSTRRIDRRRRRQARREDKLVRLRQGQNLRASAGWGTVVQALAFVRKELAEIVRQPRLLLLLVAGPFILLLLFGAGYQDTTIQLRTEFVGPADSVYEQAVTNYADQLADYIEPRGYTTDEAAARQRLDDGDLDAVVVFPPDALDTILAGERAPIRVLHEELDPFQQVAIDISARLAVQEVNATVVGAVAAGAQSVLAPIDQVASTLTEQAATLTEAAGANDPAAITAAAGEAAETLGNAAVVISSSQDVVERLGGSDAAAGADEMLGRLEAAESDARAVSETTDADVAAEAESLAATLTDVAAAIPAVATVDPAVLVRPFEAETENIVPVDVEPADFYAPSSIVLLLQHLALTFAALSLVRDRELGLLELLRVGPLSSMEILVGKTIAYLIVGLGVGASLVALAVYVLGVPFQGSLLWAAAAVVLVLLASLALGMVLSMISGSETQAVQYAMLTLLAGMFFSGFILDVSDLAMPYRCISYVLPVTYGISMMQDVMLRGEVPADADVIGLGVLVVAYGLLAVLLLRRRLRTE